MAQRTDAQLALIVAEAIKATKRGQYGFAPTKIQSVEVSGTTITLVVDNRENVVTPGVGDATIEVALEVSTP